MLYFQFQNVLLKIATGQIWCVYTLCGLSLHSFGLLNPEKRHIPDKNNKKETRNSREEEKKSENPKVSSNFLWGEKTLRKREIERMIRELEIMTK